MHDNEKRIKGILKRTAVSVHDSDTGSCPGHATLSSYINGILQETEKETIEHHLLKCRSCLNTVLLHRTTGEKEALKSLSDAPSLWKEKVKKLYRRRNEEKGPGIMDAVLRFTKEAVEVISNPGNLLLTYRTVPLTVRSGSDTLSPNHIRLSKTFSGMESHVDIERINNLYLNMKISTLDLKPVPAANALRISLFNPLRELASYITENGEVYFGNLKFGEYKIRITRGNEEIGEISLNLTLNEN